MTGSVPVDWQLTDTYFVVAHLHYVLIGINVFPVVGAIYFWFPKMTGQTDGRTAGPLEFLDHVRRLQSRLFPDAHFRAAGHAAPHLHLSAKAWAGTGSTSSPPWARSCSPSGVLLFIWNVMKSYKRWHARGRQSLGRAQLGMGNPLAAAALQFRRDPQCGEPPSLMGRPAEDPERKEKSFTRHGAGAGAREARHWPPPPLDAEPNLILKMPDDTLVPLLLALCHDRHHRGAGAGELVGGDSGRRWARQSRFSPGSGRKRNWARRRFPPGGRA